MSKIATSTVTSAPSAMTTPAQFERLGEQLRKLRLLKSGERLAARLQHAVANELPYAGSSNRCWARRWRPRRGRTSLRTTVATFPFVWPLEIFDFGYQPSMDKKRVLQLVAAPARRRTPSVSGDWLRGP